MSTEGNSYAPKSPDLSSFLSGTEVNSSSHADSNLPEIPAPPSYIIDRAYTPRASGFHLPQNSGPTSAYPLHPQIPSGIEYPHQPQQPHLYNTYHHSPAPAPASAPTQQSAASAYSSSSNNNNNNNTNGDGSGSGTSNAFNPYLHISQAAGQPQGQYLHSQQTQYQQPNPASFGLQSPTGGPPSYYSSYTDPTSSSNQQPHLYFPQELVHTSEPQTPNRPIAPGQTEASQTPSAMPPRKAAQVAKQDEILPSPVKTKFPTARIKRIMQADEEVGKVAQQTPIAVGKALELFMVQLVTKSAEVAKEKNSKRITAPMLKQAIDSANEWDFLQDIVAKVTEEKEGARGAGRAKQESDTDEEAEAAEVKKKGRGGRKKKAPA